MDTFLLFIIIWIVPYLYVNRRILRRTPYITRHRYAVAMALSNGAFYLILPLLISKWITSEIIDPKIFSIIMGLIILILTYPVAYLAYPIVRKLYLSRKS